ncbi:transposase (plasmid) [Cetobacterium somerae]|uniref:transposase n=1 Tax=Cetobacterium somerae TaxID=188913 RepID=UPI003D767789
MSLCYRKYNDGFYVKSDKKINNIFEIAKYIGRYLARPAIAEYRITDITDSSVTFWYQKPDSPKKIFLTLPMTQFIGRLLAHIPPKNFKMIRRFGLYSRRYKNKKPKKIKLFKGKISWAERIFKTFKTNPLICPKCNSNLVLLEIFHIKYGVIFPKTGFS